MLALRQQLRGSPLAFPGRLPGFDPSHPASQGIARLSTISANGIMVNLLNGAAGTVGAAATPAIEGIAGPVCAYGSSTGGTQFPFPTALDSSATIALIFRQTGANLGFCNMSSAASGFGLDSRGASNSIRQVNAVGTGLAFSSLITGAGTTSTWFLAISMSGLSTVNTTLKGNGVLLNLGTGVILSQSLSATDKQNVGNGTFTVGACSNTGAGTGASSRIAALMYSTAFLSIPQLLAWATDPWAFWYPRSSYGAIDIGGKSSAAAAFLAAWAQQNNYPVIGTGAY